jgi:hypothetical protein
MKTTFPSTLAIVVALCANLLLAAPKYAAAEAGKTNALYASSSTDSLQQQIVSKEREELECLKTGDLKHFAELLADDAIFVDDHGAASKSEIVEHTAEFRLTEYTIDEVKFVPVSTTSGLITYKIGERGNSHGREFIAQVYVSALWVERGGKMVCVFSQETAAIGACKWREEPDACPGKKQQPELIQSGTCKPSADFRSALPRWPERLAPAGLPGIRRGGNPEPPSRGKQAIFEGLYGNQALMGH